MVSWRTVYGCIRLSKNHFHVFTNHPNKAVFAIGFFLAFATCAASYAALTLLFPGTILDRAWALNPRAHAQLAPLGRSIGLAFSLLALLSLITTFGWFRRRLWAWRLCVAGIFVQSLGDFVNFFRGDHVAGALGILLATALLVWLLRPNLRSAFAP
jgi:hypothetical protein